MALVIIRRVCRSPSIRPQFFKERNISILLPKLKFSVYESPYSLKSVSKINISNYGTCTTIRYYSNTTNSKESVNVNKDKNKEEPKPSLIQRFKQMYKDYWYVLVPVHVLSSAAWFGGFYYLACSGVDIPAALELMNFSEKIVNSMRNSSMGYVAIAYALYKIVTPLRYAVTLGGTTVSIQYLRKWGYIKPLPKGKLKQLYSNTKEGFKGKKDNLIETMKESVKETKQGIKEKKSSIVGSVNKNEAGSVIKEKVITSTSNSKT
ncbi:uncharacterized protein LOC143202136 [Rhynchophorus ferrugineus]|uniref:DUF1279 domain-containing protein n=1 Tax=Rhynchophorus ferrugineus TaxID=354439 RepID=A0A834IUL9_RHYFE|nr:hypothetical protein GWI33_022434 [Rhynchophorus ferrugineus]